MAVSMLMFVFMYVLLGRIVYKLSGVLTKSVKNSSFHLLMNNPCKKYSVFDSPIDFLVVTLRFQMEFSDNFHISTTV